MATDICTVQIWTYFFCGNHFGLSRVMDIALYKCYALLQFLIFGQRVCVCVWGGGGGEGGRERGGERARGVQFNVALRPQKPQGLLGMGLRGVERMRGERADK